MPRNYQSTANAAAAARRREEMAQQRDFIRTYLAADGTFNHKGFNDEVQRRNGRPLDPAMQKYWARRVSAVLAGDK